MIGIKGRFEVYTQKVLMSENGTPILDDDGNQVPIGGRYKQTAFDNLITDSGLNQLASGSVIDYCYLSTSNVEPLVTDTSLAGVIANSNTAVNAGENSRSVVMGNVYYAYFKTFRFAAGQGTGNISKLGIGWNAAATGLWSAQLVKDSAGNNLTLTKAADEILEVTYIVSTYLNTSDYIGTITISGTTHNVTVRPSQVTLWNTFTPDKYIQSLYQCDAYTTSIGDISNKPPGSVIGTVTNIMANAKTYVDNSFELAIPITFVSSIANNASGIKSIRVTGNNSNKFYHQVEFTPSIMKTDIQKLILPDFVISWGRYVTT